MRFMTLIALTVVALATVASAQNLLADPGFESGVLGAPTGWQPFGNAVPGAANPPANVPRTGNWELVMFGNFSGGFDVSGVFEEFPCAPGDVFEMDCWSRHFSGDALVGGGPPADNWAVMKISFFDVGGNEIMAAASEAIILDGTSPTDTWIDNAPIQGTAPAGAVAVQALILFLQPANAGGALHADDVEFSAVGGGATLPGTGEDLFLRTGLNGAAPDLGDSKAAMAGDLLNVNIASDGGLFDGIGVTLLAQLGAPNVAPVAGFPIYLDLLEPVFVLADPTAAGPFAPVLGPGGIDLFYPVPAAPGMDITLQAFVSSGLAANMIFASTDVHFITQ